jgi:HAD superfamily hydrolase (TIGR01509 family)
MAVKAIVFDVGETLVDETRQREEIAAGQRAAPFTEDDLYPDALPCIGALRDRGLRVGAAGNMRSENESFLAPHVDFVSSSERWGVLKPAPEFFARVCTAAGFDPADVMYVGDRVDNDVEPALAFGMVAVHIKRGPWGLVHETPDGARRIDSLLELV